MIERCEKFGAEGGLIGMLAEPAPVEVRPDAPAILLWNVGIQHRVGPGRVWVELARRLGARGFRVLRFDLSGMGDSGTRRGGGDEFERAAFDVREAMDHLERKRGVRRFVVVGFCSGTDAAHRVAVEDPRVAGMVWIEGYAYRTRRFRLHWYTTRLLSRRRWSIFLRKQVARFSPALSAQRSLGEVDPIFVREYPDPRALGAQLERLLERGVKILVIYSGGADISYGYAGQFYDMFPHDFRGRIEERFFPDADHLFTNRGHRLHLIDLLAGWIDARFPAGDRAIGR